MDLFDEKVFPISCTSFFFVRQVDKRAVEVKFDFLANKHLGNLSEKLIVDTKIGGKICYLNVRCQLNSWKQVTFSAIKNVRSPCFSLEVSIYDKLVVDNYIFWSKIGWITWKVFLLSSFIKNKIRCTYSQYFWRMLMRMNESSGNILRPTASKKFFSSRFEYQTQNNEKYPP